MDRQDENPGLNPEPVMLTTKLLFYVYGNFHVTDEGRKVQKGAHICVMCPHSHSKSREILGPASNLSARTEGLVIPSQNAHWASCYTKPYARHQGQRNKGDPERIPCYHVRNKVTYAALL